MNFSSIEIVHRSVAEENLALSALAATMTEVIPDLFLDAQDLHPLLASVTRRRSDAATVVVSVDVDAHQSAFAKYEIPTMTLGIQMPFETFTDSTDRWVQFACDLVGAIAREYDRDLHCRLVNSTSGFLGLRAALPQLVGSNTLGSINESSFAGWRSQVVPNANSIVRSLLSLERRCTRGGKAPDLTVLDADSYYEVVSGFQPQQRFWRSVGTVPLLAFNRGSLYRDPYAEKGSIYTLHTSDFVFQDSQAKVYLDVTIDGRVRAHVRQREQLFPIRRYRSGTVIVMQGSES